MGTVVTAYSKEYLDKFEVREKIFKDRSKALSFAKALRKQGFEAKTKKWDLGHEDVWEVIAKKAK